MTSINEVQKLLFTYKGCQMSSLPPTKSALQQHIRRAVFQGGHIWATVAYRQIPSPADWGWTCSEHWTPLWTHLPEEYPVQSCCGVDAGAGDCKRVLKMHSSQVRVIVTTLTTPNVHKVLR